MGHVKTTQDAVAFVTEVGNPNGGLLLDCWHAYRGGAPYATLPVPGFIGAVLAVGWDGPWGVEHMSGDFRRLPVRDALTRARDAALHCFDLAAQRRNADPTRG